MYRFSKKALKFTKIAITAVILITAVYLVLSLFFSKNPSNQSVQDGEDYIRMLDVGQGDSTLITSSGKVCLIDTGTKESADDLIEKLKSYGVKTIDVLAITHFHADHTGGSEKITEEFKVKNLIYPNSKYSSTYSEGDRMARQNVLAEDGDFYVAKQGMNFNIGAFEITVLGYYHDIDDENNRSVFYMAKHGKRKALITGDAETEAENRILEENINVSCDILKVGHHGSSTSTSKKFLTACNPTYSVISCGAGNSYSHPHDAVVIRLENHGTNILRTDISGDVTFSFDVNNEITVVKQK